MLDALWAFKNLLYKSTLELKGRVMRALCWGSVARCVLLSFFSSPPFSLLLFPLSLLYHLLRSER